LGISGAVRERLAYANGPLARSLPAASYAALLERPMRAVENAEPLAGPFPLIVIGLGLYYESPITFSTTAEYLASRGFVVATAPLVGTHIAIVKLDTRSDADRDPSSSCARGNFARRRRAARCTASTGGTAGVVLTMRNRDVDASSAWTPAFSTCTRPVFRDLTSYDPSRCASPGCTSRIRATTSRRRIPKRSRVRRSRALGSLLAKDRGAGARGLMSYAPEGRGEPPPGSSSLPPDCSPPAPSRTTSSSSSALS
jgi:hypothetical protein